MVDKDTLRKLAEGSRERREEVMRAWMEDPRVQAILNRFHEEVLLAHKAEGPDEVGEPVRSSEAASQIHMEQDDMSERELELTPSQTLAFFASVIKSGEPWTATCQKAYDEAQAALTASRQSILEEAAKERERLREALEWALPKAEARLEIHRIERLQCGHGDIRGVHADGSVRVGLWQAEVDEIDKARAALSHGKAPDKEKGDE